MLKAAVPSPTATSRRHACRPCGASAARRRRNRGARRSCAVRRRIARFLLPQRDEVEHHGDDGGALDHLDQLELAEVGEQHAERERAGDHADQQHDIEEARRRAARMFARREIGRERKPGGLHRVQAGADQQEGERGADLPDHGRAVRVARQDRAARTA